MKLVITTAIKFSCRNNSFLINDVKLFTNVVIFDVALYNLALFDAALFDVKLF